MYDNGRWRSYYKEEAFAEAVREARRAVEHWTKIVSMCNGGCSLPHFSASLTARVAVK